jgi:hypothetical protein
MGYQILQLLANAPKASFCLLYAPSRAVDSLPPFVASLEGCREAIAPRT